MNFTLERVTDPDIEAVSLAEMKLHLRCYESTTEDDMITALITAAREWVEDYTGRALIDQTWRLTIGARLNGLVGGDAVGGYTPGVVGTREWPHWIRSGEILLRKSPVLSLTSFKSVDAAGVETDIDTDYYELREIDSKWPRIAPLNGATWPANSDLRIVFRAGFADRDSSPQETAAAVPERYKQAMKLWTEANYGRDEKLMPLLLDTAERLIRSERSEMNFA